MGTSVRDGAPRRFTPAPAQSAVQTAFLFATIECAGPLVRREDTPLRGVDSDKPLRGLCDFGEHTRTARCVKSDDMPLRGMSSHTAARYCRVICGWGSAASSTHENENPAASNFAQGVDMPRQTAKPAASCSPTDEISFPRLPSGWPSARHACLALVVPSEYREVLPSSRSASCSACARGRSQPCYSPCAYLAQPYSITLVPPRFHQPFFRLSV